MANTVNNKNSNNIIIYSVPEVAEILKTNKSYVYKLIKSGSLPCIKIGHIKIRHEALASFLEKAEGFDYTNPYNVVAC